MKRRLFTPLLAVLAAAGTVVFAGPGDNLALTGTTSSSGDGFGSSKDDPIDGNTDGNYGSGSVWHSHVNSAAGWWEVDLGSEQPIGTVKVWLRTDCCTDRNANLEVVLLDASRNEIARVRQEENPFTMTPPVPYFAVNYASATLAQFVRIDRSETPNWIQLAEVQVFQAVPEGTTINISGLSNASGVENKSITFGPIAAIFSTGNPVTDLNLQWSVNDVEVPGATGRSLTLARLLAADNNAVIKVAASSLGAAGLAQATLTVTPDLEAPTISKASGSAALTDVTLWFSEPLDAASAETAANYTLDGGVTVSAAVLSSPNTVVLTTSAQTSGNVYNLSVSGVKDTAAAAGNPVAAGTKVSFTAWVLYPGGILHNFYQYPGTPSLATVTADVDAGRVPTFSSVEPLAEYGPGGSNEAGGNYGNKLSGWFTASETADYVFFVSGDDNIALYLSTDSDPANKKLIAREPQWNNARAWLVGDRRAAAHDNRSDTFAGTEWEAGATISLNQGSVYYFEALHQEGGGGDSVGITFKLASEEDPANGTEPRLSGENVGLWLDPQSLFLNITQQPLSKTVGELTSPSLTAVGSAPYAIRYQWQKAPAGSLVFADIDGATSPTLTVVDIPLTEGGSKYRCVLKTFGKEATSDVAVLTVAADKTAPTVACVAVSGGLSSVFLTFSERVTAETALAAGNYAIEGATVESALLNSAGNKVILTTSPLTAGAFYQVRISGVKDISTAGNVVVPGNSVNVEAVPASYSDALKADGPILYYNFNDAQDATVAVNLGSLGEQADGLYSIGTGVIGDAGPQPPDFVGFGSDNGAPTFAGDGFVDAQGKWLNGLGAFTLEYWVKPTAFTGSRVGIVGQNDAVEYGFINPNTIQIWTPGGGSLDTTYSFERDTWHHVASIGTGKRLETYFDGVLINSGGGVTANYGSSTFNVKIAGGGVFDGAGNFFTGQIDEVAIFDKALTGAQVRSHFLAGTEGPSPAPKIVSIVTKEGNVVIDWLCGGTLQTANEVDGTWSDVVGATTPYSAAASGAHSYFRLRR